jgi:hypothetical protein
VGDTTTGKLNFKSHVCFAGYRYFMVQKELDLQVTSEPVSTPGL